MSLSQTLLPPLKAKASNGAKSPLWKMDEGAWRQELRAALTLTAETVMQLAEIVAVGKARGFDSGLHIDTVSALTAIHTKLLAAEAFMVFRDAPHVVKALMALPIEEQRHWAANPSTKVQVKTADGKSRSVPLVAAKVSDLAQVFDPVGRRVVPVAEQTLPRRVTRNDGMVAQTIHLTEAQAEKLREHAGRFNESPSASIVGHLVRTGFFK